MCERDAPTRLSRRAALALGAGGLAALATGCGGRLAGQQQEEVQAFGAGTVGVAPGLAIWPRAAWGGDLLPKGELLPEDVRFLLVHHSATTNIYTQASIPAVLRNVYAFHTGPAKGWPDICYNFFVDRYGGVWEARTGSLDGPVMASATGGSQGFAQLVCLLGDFTNELPTPAAMSALTTLLAWLGGQYGLDTSPGATTTFVSRGSQRWAPGVPVTTSTIAGHRDMSYTGCPGDRLYPVVRNQLPAQVTALRQQWAAPATSNGGQYAKAQRVTPPVRLP
jgi:hypothetical protein